MTSQWRHRNKTHSCYSKLNYVQNLYFEFFIFWKLTELCRFVTYLWDDPRRSKSKWLTTALRICVHITLICLICMVLWFLQYAYSFAVGKPWWDASVSRKYLILGNEMFYVGLESFKNKSCQSYFCVESWTPRSCDLSCCYCRQWQSSDVLCTHIRDPLQSTVLAGGGVQDSPATVCSGPITVAGLVWCRDERECLFQSHSLPFPMVYYHSQSQT